MAKYETEFMLEVVKCFPAGRNPLFMRKTLQSHAPDPLSRNTIYRDIG
jgi:hypothetical protein